jgi:hypothetical protein
MQFDCLIARSTNSIRASFKLPMIWPLNSLFRDCPNLLGLYFDGFGKPLSNGDQNTSKGYTLVTLDVITTFNLNKSVGICSHTLLQDTVIVRGSLKKLHQNH